jgi:hypothetical protein
VALNKAGTYPGYTEVRNEFPNQAPKTLATLPIQKTKSDTFTRVVDNLARPLVAVSMEDRESEEKTFTKFR